jgi:DNA-binding XRE family transcriptional regulator
VVTVVRIYSSRRTRPASDYGLAEKSSSFGGAGDVLLPNMLRIDRIRWGMSQGEAGWRLGITRREYVAIEDGEKPPNADQYEAVCEFFR